MKNNKKRYGCGGRLWSCGFLHCQQDGRRPDPFCRLGLVFGGQLVQTLTRLVLPAQ